jgi:hypothetical protein
VTTLNYACSLYIILQPRHQNPFPYNKNIIHFSLQQPSKTTMAECIEIKLEGIKNEYELHITKSLGNERESAMTRQEETEEISRLRIEIITREPPQVMLSNERHETQQPNAAPSPRRAAVVIRPQPQVRQLRQSSEEAGTCTERTPYPPNAPRRAAIRAVPPL